METIWAGIRVVVPKGRPDRLQYLAENSMAMAVYRFTTPCGRKVAFAVEDIPDTNLRCWCGEEFLVQWVDGSSAAGEAWDFINLSEG